MQNKEGTTLGENMRKSSFFQRARQSFFRSQGKRGATVENLRGTAGVDFEGVAKVARGQSPACICNMFGARSGTFKKVYVVVKGPFCFVFSDKSSPSPSYAIGLQYMRSQVSGGRVSLTDSSGTVVDYRLVFEDEADALMFGEQVTQQAGKAQTEIVRLHLGHESLLNKRKSILFAEQVALEKEKNQPQKPVSDTDVLDVMASAINVPLQ